MSDVQGQRHVTGARVVPKFLRWLDHRGNKENHSMDLKLEVLVIPVSDVDKAKAFYEQLGFRLDADYPVGDSFRVVQVTPPGLSTTPARRTAFPACIPSAPATVLSRPSATRTATAGPSRRTSPELPVADRT
jgi:hypothetical protein